MNLWLFLPTHSTCLLQSIHHTPCLKFSIIVNTQTLPRLRSILFPEWSPIFWPTASPDIKTTYQIPQVTDLNPVVIYFFWKKPGSRFLVFEGYIVSVTITQHCCHCTKAAIDVSEWAWLSSSTTLFVKQVEGTDLAHRLQFSHSFSSQQVKPVL